MLYSSILCSCAFAKHKMAVTHGNGVTIIFTLCPLGYICALDDLVWLVEVE